MALKTDVDLESIENGDTITWAEDWTSGTKTFEAVVIDIERKHITADLVTPAHDIANLVLDVTDGDEKDIDPALNKTDDGHLKTTVKFNEE